MAKNSGIQWTTHTFNPWWGCIEVSEACRSCYAKSFAKRVGENVWGGADTPRRMFGDKHWDEPLKWNRAALKAGERHRVFCASMADVFEDRRDLDASRARLWSLIAATPALDWLLLSKRWGTADIEAMVPEAWRGGWPANVWAGATVENQARAEERLPALLHVPATVHFLSMEPLLGPVDLMPYIGAGAGHRADYLAKHGEIRLHRPTWIIIGGESGPRARGFHLVWTRSLIEQAAHTDTKVFLKQLGANPWEEHITLSDGSLHPVPTRRLPLRDSHGGDESEWPADLQGLRAFPTVPERP